MGMLKVIAGGSFPNHNRTFSASDRGHAHAVAEAIEFLSSEVLPEAIERDHRLHDQGGKPAHGFDRAAEARRAVEHGLGIKLGGRS